MYNGPPSINSCLRGYNQRRFLTKKMRFVERKKNRSYENKSRRTTYNHVFAETSTRYRIYTMMSVKGDLPGTEFNSTEIRAFRLSGRITQTIISSAYRRTARFDVSDWTCTRCESMQILWHKKCTLRCSLRKNITVRVGQAIYSRTTKHCN